MLSNVSKKEGTVSALPAREIEEDSVGTRLGGVSARQQQPLLPSPTAADCFVTLHGVSLTLMRGNSSGLWELQIETGYCDPAERGEGYSACFYSTRQTLSYYR